MSSADAGLQVRASSRRLTRAVTAFACTAGVASLLLAGPTASAAAAPTSGPAFAPAHYLEIEGLPSAVAVGDVTGDGRADVLAAGSLSEAGMLWVFPQRADGTLAFAPTTYRLAAGMDGDFDVGDIDADGDQDVAVATGAGVEILLQSGGVLSSEGIVAVSGAPRFLNIGDIDGDADGDIVLMTDAATVREIRVRLLRNTGSGFDPSVVDREIFVDLALADVTGDANLDVIGFRGPVHVYPGDGAGAFGDAIVYERAAGSVWGRGGDAADVNGDGRTDVITSGDPVNIFAQKADGTLATPIVADLSQGSREVFGVDIDASGHGDIVVPGALMSFYRDGAFSPPCRYPMFGAYDPYGSAVADVNGDDQPDFVTLGGAGVAIHTQLSHGEVSPSSIDVYVNGRRSVEVTPGSGLVFFGRFGFPDGGCNRQEIVLTRAKDGEGPVQVARITSVPDFGANDQFFYEGAAPTTPGHYTYAAVYPGDSEHSSAVASVDVSVSRYPSQLELRADPRRVRFRGSTHVTVRIAALDGSNRAVELFATPHRHATSSIGTVIVDRDGRGSTVVSDLTRNTVITAEWEGDATYAPEHDSTTVRVYARATGRLTNAQTTSRKYRLYREGRNIEYEAKVAPNHAGDDVRMTLEVFYRRRWRNLDSYWFRLRRDSTATLRLETRGAPLDIPFRIRARYPEGNGNLADDSAWSYFKIVR